MEFSRYPEEYSWKRSCSEERDRSDQNDDTGIGRSYECVFCKRGFTTAQALGGHMNIHRKDRAKPKPKPKPTITPNSPSTKLLHRHYNDYSDHLGFYYSPTHDHEVEVDATSSNANNYHYPPPPPTIPACSHHLHYPDQEEDVLAQDWSTRTLTFFSNHPFSLPQNKHNPQRNNNQEVPLDLELRLGYHHP